MEHNNNNSNSNGFISIGCGTDRDCAYKDADGTEIFNYQSCRAYPNKGLPIEKATNGCICLNHINSAYVDSNTGRVFCTRNDGGSIAIYCFDSFVVLLHLIIAFRCLHLLSFFAMMKMKQSCRSVINREKQASLVKIHSLICLFFLLMSALCFSTFRIITLVGNTLGLKSDIDIPDKQGRFDEGSLRSFIWFAYMFLGLCCLHFTILWLSTTRVLFSREVKQSSGSCFNVTFYKRFITIAEVVTFVFILIPVALRLGIIFPNFVIFALGVVIIYEFAWGCRNIIQLLRLIASWSKSRKLSSIVVDTGIHEVDTATKLSRVADKIEKFSSRIRVTGGLLVVCYGLYSLLSFLG